MNQSIVLLLLTSFVVLPRGSTEADEQQQPRPNVLFLAVDDMKDWVNCLGGYEGTVFTPNIDRLASRGMLFTNAQCPSPKCAPSRAAIMTGLRPSTTGLYDNGHWWLPNLPDVCDRPVSLLDLYPTLNELAGLEMMPTHDGVSLAPLLRNPQIEWNRPAVIEFKRGNAAVRSDRYRYIRYHDGGEELYDHRSDPHEWHNLATTEGHEAIKQELAEWIPKNWAPSAPTKDAYRFDPHAFTWKHKKTGTITHGRARQ